MVTYQAQGYRVKGYLALPRPTMEKQRFPLLIYCRGGIRRVGMTRLAWISRFVENGYAVFAPVYRGNYGGEGREDFGAEDRHDVLDAIPPLMNLPQVDENRIHLFGFSRGAMMAFWPALAFPAIRSLTFWGGVSDLTLTYKERVDLRRMLKRVIGGSPQKFPDEYRLRSPLSFVSSLNIPVLIIHGMLDKQVGVEHAFRFQAALEKHHKAYTFWLFETEGHFFRPPVFEQTVKNMLDWMRAKE